jgi:hypothetical protein
MITHRPGRLRLALVPSAAVLAATLGLSDLLDSDVGAASAATASSTNLMVSTYVPLVCTASTGSVPGSTTGAASGSATQPPASAPAATSGAVSVSIGTPATSRCSDGSTPAVTVEQSSGVISASSLDGATVSSSVERDGTRIVVSELALDGRTSPLRLVTVTY